MPSSNIFEMQTYANTDADVKSSTVQGTIQRLHFTISGIVNPLYTPGEMPGALQQKAVQFGIQIYDLTIEDQSKRSTSIMMFYNNRINDPQFTGIPKGGSVIVKFPPDLVISSSSRISVSFIDVRSANSSINVTGTIYVSSKDRSILFYSIESSLSQSGAIRIETWNGPNFTLDYGTSNSVPLQANLLRNLVIGLSSYETGKTNVTVSITFQINNPFASNLSRIILQFPTSDLYLAAAKPSLKMSLDAPYQHCSPLTPGVPGYTSVEVCTSQQLEGGSTVSFEVEGFRNRFHAGTFNNSILIETQEIFSGSTRILDFGVAKPAAELVPSSLVYLNATFPSTTDDVGNVTVEFTPSISLSTGTSCIDISLTPGFHVSQNSVAYLEGVRKSSFNQSFISIDLDGIALMANVMYRLIIVGVVSPYYTIERALNITTRNGDAAVLKAVQRGRYADGSLNASPMQHLQMTLLPLVSGATSSLNISFDCNKQVPAYSGILLDFPDGFDVTGVHVVRKQNLSLVADRLCNMEICNTSFVFNSTSHFLEGNFTYDYKRMFTYFDYSLTGIAGSLAVRVDGNSIELMLVDRIMNSTWHPPLFRLKHCMKLEARQCWV